MSIFFGAQTLYSPKNVGFIVQYAISNIFQNLVSSICVCVCVWECVCARVWTKLFCLFVCLFKSQSKFPLPPLFQLPTPTSSTPPPLFLFRNMSVSHGTPIVVWLSTSSSIKAGRDTMIGMGPRSRQNSQRQPPLPLLVGSHENQVTQL